jgi:hypothetical protein
VGTGSPSGRANNFVRRGTAWSEVSKLGETTFRIRLGGLLQTAWMAALCNRLADCRISIDHTHARRARDDSWIAELHVVALAGALDPMNVPYVELTEADDAIPSATLRIDSYRLIESRDYGGTLMLALEAPDTLGLLGALLASLAALTLFPIEVHIETRAGRAYDSLWIGAAEGASPSAQARDALDRLLANSLRRAT